MVRHVGFTKLREDGTPDGEAFRLGATESGLSVNWIEYFSGLDKASALEEIRCQVHRNLGRQSKFAELNVGQLKGMLATEGLDVGCVHDPLCTCGRYPEDESHSQICGLPASGSPESEQIGDMIADLVSECHPAVLG